MNHCKKVIFCWIQSHTRIQGNDKADLLAEATLNIAPDQKKNKSTIYWHQTENQANNYKEMATILGKNPHKKLFQVQTILKRMKLDPYNTRWEETTLGHTRLTHSFHKSNQHSTKVLYCWQYEQNIQNYRPFTDIELSEKNRPPMKNVHRCIFHSCNHLTVKTNY